jgi:hypothetical protein
MTLSEKILAGRATDEEVAEALGYSPAGRGEWGNSAHGHIMFGPPPLQTCLTTLAAEVRAILQQQIATSDAIEPERGGNST